MAIINLTKETTDCIIGEVVNVFNQERMPLLEQKFVVPSGVGDDIMSWVVPRETNKKLLEIMPEWCTRTRNHIYLSVCHASGQNVYNPTIALQLNEAWYSYSPKKVILPTITGAKSTTFNGELLTLYLEDTSGLPQGQAADFVKSLLTLAQQHNKVTDKTNAAAATMREFLDQHRTLQTALKECPAIISYVPDWLKQELNRVPPKRTRRPPIPKGEKKQVDMTELVAQATIAKLNL